MRELAPEYSALTSLDDGKSALTLVRLRGMLASCENGDLPQLIESHDKADDKAATQ
jgi:hypothetical protein